MDAAIEWHRWLQDLLILLTDSDYCLEWPEVRWGKHNCTLYFQRLSSKAGRPRLHECVTNFPKISESFGTLFEEMAECSRHLRAGGLPLPRYPKQKPRHDARVKR
jgi:hypothetical protein